MSDEGRMIRFSVVIPLYNKEREIVRALDSAAAQSYAPHEIIVVDDGSTDSGASLAAAHPSPLVRVVRQSNAGVSAARNAGIALASGTHVALLDGDDCWERDYLREMALLIEQFPGCGAYSSAFNIIDGESVTRSHSPRERGVVADFFRKAVSFYICQPSSTIIPREVFERVGGFPLGMRLGEDLYMWIKIALRHDVCFNPEPLVRYYRSASNRSTSIYAAEQTDYSFEDFHDPRQCDEAFWLNEFLARCAIGKALTLSAKGDTEFGRRTEEFFAYTRHYRLGLWKLRVLNRLPRRLRAPLLDVYNRLAWLLARKGL